MRLLKLALLAISPLLLLTLGGCSTFTSPARVHALETSKPYWMDLDASRRGTLVVPEGSGVKVCAEPAPDVAITFAQKILIDVQAQAQKNPNIDAKAQAELSATALELAGRTQLVLILRESLYRLCEQSLNGSLNHEEVKQLYELVINTTLKLAETDLAKNQKALAEALKDPAVREIWTQMHNGTGSAGATPPADVRPPADDRQSPTKKPVKK